MAENRGRGALRVEGDLRGQTRVLDEPRMFQMPSAGIQEEANKLAGEFSEIGSKIGRIADHAAQVEGKDAGKIAGLDPEFRPTKQMTIRGEAFDKAGLDTYEAKIKLEIGQDLQATFDANKGDPAKLKAALDQKRSAWLTRTLPEVQPEVQLLWDKTSLAYHREAVRELAARRAAEQRAALQTELGETLKGIHQRAYRLGLDPAADDAAATDITSLQRTLSRVGADGKPLFTPEQRAGLISGTKEQIAQARLFGAFERLPDVDTKRRFILQLDEDFARSQGLAKTFTLDKFRSISRSLEAELRREEMLGKTATRVVEQQIQKVEKLAEKGFSPGEDELAKLRAEVITVANPELRFRLAEAEDHIQFQSAARRGRPEELEAYILNQRREMRDGADPRGVKRLEVAERLLDKMQVELKQDQLGWADRVGLIKTAPVDLTSGETVLKTLPGRIAQAEEVAGYYGLKPQYLKPDEVKHLSAIIASGGEGALRVASALSEAAGPKARQVLAQVADQAPAMAWLGSLVAQAPGGPPSVAVDAANGLALRKSPGHKARGPKAEEQKVAFNDVVSTTFAALADQPVEDAVIAIANAAYDVRAHAQGKTEFDDKLYKQVLREALGERTVGGETYGGVGYQRGWFRSSQPILLPPNVKQRAASQILDELRDGDLVDEFNQMPRHGNGKPVSMSAIRAAQLVTVGHGRYQLAMGDVGSNPLWIRGSNGRPYVLDLNVLEPALRRRRPDLFLGGK